MTDDSQKRRRGRPRLGAAAVAGDRLIARTVHQLAYWGFPLRPASPSSDCENVFEAVARAFRDLADEQRRIRRTDQNVELSAKRVEQIYARWKRDPPPEDEFVIRGSLARFTALSRFGQIPTDALDVDLLGLARMVLEKGGRWPQMESENDPIIREGAGAFELTPKAAEQEAKMPRIRGWRLGDLDD